MADGVAVAVEPVIGETGAAGTMAAMVAPIMAIMITMQVSLTIFVKNSGLQQTGTVNINNLTCLFLGSSTLQIWIFSERLSYRRS